MKYKKLGNSTLSISSEGYGCMGLSEFYGDIDENRAEKIINMAISGGVNFFDTADIYGFGHNENLLGKILLNHSDKKIIVATKCGIVRDPNNTRHREVNNTKEYIFKCFEESNKRLGRNIDLYYLHRVIQKPESIKDAMKAMYELKKRGKIQAIGLSEVNAESIRLSHEFLLEYSQGEFGLNAVQTEFSLVSRDIENNNVLDTCQELGVSVVAYSPVSRGLLGGKLKSLNSLDKNDSRRYLPRFMNENLEKNNLIVKELIEYSNSINITPAQLSLAWIMSKKENIIPIPGTKTTQHLLDNMAASDINLTANQVKNIEDILLKYEVHGTRYPEEFMKAYDMSK